MSRLFLLHYQKFWLGAFFCRNLVFPLLSIPLSLKSKYLKKKNLTVLLGITNIFHLFFVFFTCNRITELLLDASIWLVACLILQFMLMFFILLAQHSLKRSDDEKNTESCHLEYAKCRFSSIHLAWIRLLSITSEPVLCHLFTLPVQGAPWHSLDLLQNFNASWSLSGTWSMTASSNWSSPVSDLGKQEFSCLTRALDHQWMNFYIFL